jgi:hypothetical protein
MSAVQHVARGMDREREQYDDPRLFYPGRDTHPCLLKLLSSLWLEQPLYAY